MPTLTTDNKHVVPAADSADNANMRDVIGNKTDTQAGNSLYALVDTLNDHIHTEAKVYPTLANGVEVLGGAAWTLGDFVEIVPADTIAAPFDIHYINIEALSVAEVYEIVLYAVSTEIGRIRVAKDAIQAGLNSKPITTPIIPANTQIRAKSASESGADTATISLSYHTY